MAGRSPGRASAPQLSPPVDDEPDPLLIDTALLNASGRFCARRLLQALAWQPGQRVDIAVLDDAAVIGAAARGQHLVGSRGDLALPASARDLLSLDPGATVVLMTAPRHHVLVVHPAAVITDLLSEHYARQQGADDDG